jgi:hypothetical protein
MDLTKDPVCGMTVDPDQARQKGLILTHDGTEYAFARGGPPYHGVRLRPSREGME